MRIPLGDSIPRRQHLLAGLIFVAVIVVVFWRAIFLGEVLAPLDLLTKDLPWRAVLPANIQIKNAEVADIAAVFYPWKHFVHEELQAGRFPLWCKSVGCGYPLAGEGIIKLFGLTTLCLWFASPPVASLLSFSAQLFIALTGMYVLLLETRVRWSACVFGALVYGLNTTMFQHLEFEHMTGGLMMLPWMCWALWRGGRYDALAGLFFGLAILNGSVQSGAMCWISAAGLVLVLSPDSTWPQKMWVALKRVMLFSVLGGAVAAVSLLPNLELIHLNTRDRFDRIDWVGLMWKRPVIALAWVASQINPNLIGHPKTADLLKSFGMVGFSAAPASKTDLRIYGGLAATLLVWRGLFVTGAARRVALSLVLIPLAVIVISPLFFAVYFRGLAAINCGLAILAALGFDVWISSPAESCRQFRRPVIAVAGLAILLLIVGVVVEAKSDALITKVQSAVERGTSFWKADAAWQREKAVETVQNFSWRGAAVGRFGILVALVAGVLLIPRGPVIMATGCLLLNTADLVDLAWRIVPLSPAAWDYPLTPALQFLRQQPGYFRVGSAWNRDTEPPTAYPNCLLPCHIDDARVYESLWPDNPLLTEQAWDDLNVRFFIVPPGHPPPSNSWARVFAGEVDIYENTNVQPRFGFATGLRSGIIKPITSDIQQYDSGHIQFRVTAPSTGWMVVRERSYPGWSATLNGQSISVDRAQGMWLAVPVEAGPSDVRLEFKPPLVRWGAIVSAFGVVAALALVIRGKESNG